MSERALETLLRKRNEHVQDESIVRGLARQRYTVAGATMNCIL